MGVVGRIGDGSNIRVLSEPWLLEDDNFILETSLVQGHEDLRVCDLWIPGYKERDIGLLTEFFCPRDVAAILRIPYLANMARILAYGSSLQTSPILFSLATASSWKY
ncbi:hypothetical protein MRB53_032164 [Persea americana]|uniref:Uncharacterized protein n=1 Tax=Persea americana TaxID=3435 RepID=A0ACC2KR08_PERAE|nr:hypothetical protein MRB53_032164 [Persea americana]